MARKGLNKELLWLAKALNIKNAAKTFSLDEQLAAAIYAHIEVLRDKTLRGCKN